jgi:DNA polymerase-3 subunit gamma/tau
MDLYRKYRPTRWEDVVGQDEAIRVLRSKVDSGTLNHVVLLSGQTGAGKTSVARVMAAGIGATDPNIVEINCGHVRSIEDVRDIDSVMRLSPMGGKARVWILDEIIQLPKTTQQAFLKVLEDTPPHVYFFLCGSEITGLLPTFKDRCFHVAFQPLTNAAVDSIIRRVVKAEDRQVGSGVINVIVQKAEGSGRRALQFLEAVLSVDPQDDNDKDQLQALNACPVECEEKSEFLAKILIYGNAPWKTTAQAINAIEDKDLETIRRQVLAYAGKVILSGQLAAKAYKVVQAFKEPFFNSGKAGLIAACWELKQ